MKARCASEIPHNIIVDYWYKSDEFNSWCDGLSHGNTVERDHTTVMEVFKNWLVDLAKKNNALYINPKSNIDGLYIIGFKTKKERLAFELRGLIV